MKVAFIITSILSSSALITFGFMFMLAGYLAGEGSFKYCFPAFIIAIANFVLLLLYIN